jgi:hypothetical protein
VFPHGASSKKKPFSLRAILFKIRMAIHPHSSERGILAFSRKEPRAEAGDSSLHSNIIALSLRQKSEPVSSLIPQTTSVYYICDHRQKKCYVKFILLPRAESDALLIRCRLGRVRRPRLQLRFPSSYHILNFHDSLGMKIPSVLAIWGLLQGVTYREGLRPFLERLGLSDRVPVRRFNRAGRRRPSYHDLSDLL